MITADSVLAIDESWSGFAIVYHNYVLGISIRKVFDIRKGKRYTQMKQTIASVYELFETVFEEEPLLYYCDYVIVESQFRSNMKNLELVVRSLIYAKFQGEILVDVMTAYLAKKLNKLPLEVSHRANKKSAIDHVEKNPQLIAWAPNIKDDNICDAILLLNAAQHTRFRPSSSIMAEYVDNDNVCPNCSQNLNVFRIKKLGPNTGKLFYSCPANRDNEQCRKSVPFLTWRDGEQPPSIGSRITRAPGTPIRKPLQPIPRIDTSNTEVMKQLQELNRKLDRLLFYSSDQTAVDEHMPDSQESQYE